MLTRCTYSLLFPFLLIGLLAGCNRSGVYGVVTNHEGETLPGVIVRLSTDHEVSTQTNVLGEYHLNTEPGEHTLEYAKSGYTLVKGSYAVKEATKQPLPVVEMWNLPSENSVFLCDKTLYSATTWLKPSMYYMADSSKAYGTTRDPQLQTDDSTPLIVCYRMPRYDARLTRLLQAKAQLPQDDKQTFDVWVPAGSSSVDLIPLIPSDPSLLHVKLYEELAPGRYALHWGALTGYTTIDERMYMFEVLEKVDPFGGSDPGMDGQDKEITHIEGDAP